MLGLDQPVILNLIDVPVAMTAMNVIFFLILFYYGLFY